MKLSTWAKKQGVFYRTAWRWFKAGTLPVRAEQMATGTVILHEEEAPSFPATNRKTS
jgi:putative resolvase